MSEENVEIVRKALDALNVRHRDLALSLMDPGIEFRSALLGRLMSGTASR